MLTVTAGCPCRKGEHLCICLRPQRGCPRPSHQTAIRLQQLNMEDSGYRYSPLPGPRHIRLLRLKPRADTQGPELSIELIIVSLDEPLLFEALSYAWGDPLPQAEIRCSGLTAKIGLSLYGALRQLQSHAPGFHRLIWADALCINQEDTAERSSQVRMMGDIYAKAISTMVWLGEEDADITRGMLRLSGFSAVWARFYRPEKWQEQVSILEGDKSPATESILKSAFGEEATQIEAFKDIWMLLRRPWFTRKWVIQEVVKSVKHGIVLMAGSKILNWLALEWFILLLEASSSTISMFYGCCPWRFGTSPVDSSDIAYVVICRAKTLARTLDGDFSLMSLLVRTLYFRCTDPRDHIIALLGIASNSPTYEDLTDYDCSSEVLNRRLACACVKDPQDLHILWSFASFVPGDRRHPISWMQNIEQLLSMSSVVVQILETDMDAHFCTITRLDAVITENQLQIKGRVVDRLEELGTNMGTCFEKICQIMLGGPPPVSAGEADRWLDECEAISERANKDEDNYLAALLDKDTLEATTPEIASVTMKDFQAYRSYLKVVASAVDKTSYEKALANKSGIEFYDRTHSLMATLLSRRFSRTSQGRLGWVPHAAEAGDLICVFDGMFRPYVVRPKRESEGVYTLVGQCLISGLVDGEQTQTLENQSVPIKLE